QVPGAQVPGAQVPGASSLLPDRRPLCPWLALARELDLDPCVLVSGCAHVYGWTSFRPTIPSRPCPWPASRAAHDLTRRGLARPTALSYRPGLRAIALPPRRRSPFLRGRPAASTAPPANTNPATIDLWLSRATSSPPSCPAATAIIARLAAAREPHRPFTPATAHASRVPRSHVHAAATPPLQTSARYRHTITAITGQR